MRPLHILIAVFLFCAMLEPASIVQAQRYNNNSFYNQQQQMRQQEMQRQARERELAAEREYCTTRI